MVSIEILMINESVSQLSYYTLVTVPGPAHLNWRLLVPRSLDNSPTLSTLELLSSLMLWPVFRLLVLLHRRFQD